MGNLKFSILNFKVVHKNKIEELKKQIKDLEDEIRIIGDSHDRIYDV
jgi:hypothetical protein